MAQGHDAALSIDLYCSSLDVSKRPAPIVETMRQKMGIHEWAYSNQTVNDLRYKVPHADKTKALADRLMEVELGLRLNLPTKKPIDVSIAMCKRFLPTPNASNVMLA